jgi:hypothetical protein
LGDFLKNLFRAAFPADPNQVGTAVFAEPGTSEAILGKSEGMLKIVKTAYRRRFQEYGPEPQGVYWSNAENVKRRFDVLCRIFDPQDIALGESSINDLGCGYGALYDYLVSNPIMRGGSYYGYDICENLLDACAKRVKDPRAHFHQSMRATETADYSLVSGTFNLNINADDNQWLAYVLASLQDLWDKTDKGMAFNMLHIKDKTSQDGLYYADPLVFEGFCRTHLSNDVTIRDDYGLPDFTIYVRR